MPSIIHNRKSILPDGGVSTSSFTSNFSMLFDGVDERININTVGAALSLTTIGTWSFWVKPVDATPAAYQMFITFGNGDSTDMINLFLDVTTGFLWFYVYNNGVAQWHLITDAAPFSDNVWAHCAVVQDGVSPVIYVNAIAPAQTFPITTDKTVWFNNLIMNNGRIGCRFWTAAEGDGALPFNGNIDEVRFWNRAFSAADILDDYNGGRPKAPNTNGLITSFRMGDGDIWNGTNWTLIDTVSGNNGTSVMMEEADRVADTP